MRASGATGRTVAGKEAMVVVGVVEGFRGVFWAGFGGRSGVSFTTSIFGRGSGFSSGGFEMIELVVLTV